MLDLSHLILRGLVCLLPGVLPRAWHEDGCGRLVRLPLFGRPVFILLPLFQPFRGAKDDRNDLGGANGGEHPVVPINQYENKRITGKSRRRRKGWEEQKERVSRA